MTKASKGPCATITPSDTNRSKVTHTFFSCKAKNVFQLFFVSPELKKTLWENARQLYTGLQDLGFELGPEISPVVAVRCRDRETALTNWNKLLQAGVYVNMMLPPATPAGASFLRCSISAAHSPAQIETIISKFKQLVVPT